MWHFNVANVTALAVHYRCSQLLGCQIQSWLSFKERRYQCPNCTKASQQVLEESELSRKYTIEINDDDTNKEVNVVFTSLQYRQQQQQ